MNVDGFYYMQIPKSFLLLLRDSYRAHLLNFLIGFRVNIKPLWTAVGEYALRRVAANTITVRIYIGLCQITSFDIVWLLVGYTSASFK